MEKYWDMDWEDLPFDPRDPATSSALAISGLESQTSSRREARTPLEGLTAKYCTRETQDAALAKAQATLIEVEEAKAEKEIQEWEALQLADLEKQKKLIAEKEAEVKKAAEEMKKKRMQAVQRKLNHIDYVKWAKEHASIDLLADQAAAAGAKTPLQIEAANNQANSADPEPRADPDAMDTSGMRADERGYLEPQRRENDASANSRSAARRRRKHHNGKF
jgi:hypothetical protein